ncbi:MAG: galactosyltransferase-related protein, partial [Gemmatimonadales bacterium]
MTEPRGVILVPRRRDHGYRDEVWAWVRAWWERELPELPIFEGHHDDGLFNRSAACNAAAAAATAAGPWDVALLIDADVFCDPPRVREALVLAVGEGNRMVLPFTRRHNLNQPGTRRIMAGDRGSWVRYIAKTYREMCSSCIAIPRALWDQVGGFDERFQGWGFEDNAFAAACETFGTTLTKIDGELWHLFHPTALEGRPGTPSFRANRARADAYQAAIGNPDAIRSLQRGEEVLILAAQPNENIPRILHRVVPEISPPESELWWLQFAALHPDWTLMTHRDPLQPADWPLTARYWTKCRTGAQLAGLVRLEALWRWGGVYVDQDVEPYRS